MFPLLTPEILPLPVIRPMTRLIYLTTMNWYPTGQPLASRRWKSNIAVNSKNKTKQKITLEAVFSEASNLIQLQSYYNPQMLSSGFPESHAVACDNSAHKHCHQQSIYKRENFTYVCLESTLRLCRYPALIHALLMSNINFQFSVS